MNESMLRALSVASLALLGGCKQTYSPNTYASGAVQQASKVDQGVVIGRRTVDVTPPGTTGAVTGATAGGIAGSQVGNGVTQAFGALGGGLVGGVVGTAVEKTSGQTVAYEYVVRKVPSNELVSVTQQDTPPLPIGAKVLVIAGAQARIVPDYTATLDPAPPAANTQPTAPPPAPVATTPLPTPAPSVLPDFVPVETPASVSPPAP